MGRSAGRRTRVSRFIGSYAVKSVCRVTVAFLDTVAPILSPRSAAVPAAAMSESDKRASTAHVGAGSGVETNSNFAETETMTLGVHAVVTTAFLEFEDTEVTDDAD